MARVRRTARPLRLSLQVITYSPGAGAVRNARHQLPVVARVPTLRVRMVLTNKMRPACVTAARMVPTTSLRVMRACTRSTMRPASGAGASEALGAAVPTGVTRITQRARNGVARLNANGSLDAAFNPHANDDVWSVALQADGKVLIGRGFTTVGGVARNNVARLRANGRLDTSFINPNADAIVQSVALQADGKVLIGGGFTTVGGLARNNVARLLGTGPTGPCAQGFYQQAARTWKNARAPSGRAAVKVTSRIRIYQDTLAACRTDLTFIFRDARTKARLAQLQGSTLGYRKLTGQDLSAPVISWPTTREMRFTGGDTTGQNRRNARLVLVSYLRRTRSTPAQRNVELVIVRQVPRDASQAVSAGNPLFAQLNGFGTRVGWAQTS